MRLDGATEGRPRAGGGIVSSVKATNALSVDSLVAASPPQYKHAFLPRMTTIEIRIDYGLNMKPS